MAGEIPDKETDKILKEKYCEDHGQGPGRTTGEKSG
jgi:hypothetical protein